MTQLEMFGIEGRVVDILHPCRCPRGEEALTFLFRTSQSSPNTRSIPVISSLHFGRTYQEVPIHLFLYKQEVVPSPNRLHNYP
jgi:hypothetical protein